MANSLIDTHCHLDLEQFDEDRDEVVQRAREVGVALIVNPGIDLMTSQRAIALAEKYDLVYAAVGLHPNELAEFRLEMVSQVAVLAQHPKVVAIGEIGLDYYWKRTPREIQIQAFRAQLDLAASLGLPVIIHNRDAHADVRAILREWAQNDAVQRSSLVARPFLGVLHAYSGDLEMAEEVFSWGFLVSLGGPVTFTNARRLHALVPQLPLSKLMLETDAPFLAPHPHRGKRNEPAYVSLVADAVAALHARSRDEVVCTTGETASRFFGLKQADAA